ncbi:MAG: cobalamin-dependent protein [Desulfobacteraceae bacterium]|nr:cobalamin-dependent protein [Desulfobacteraceae bacterium]
MGSQLSEEISALPEIPPQSAQAYRTHLGDLVEKVNTRMHARPDISLLIGENPIRMMFDNHQNHALFMSNVFSLNAFALLADTLPWVYRTYHHHGFDWQYFPAHLESWVQVLEQTMAPDIADPLIRVYKWMQSHHADFIELAGRPSPLRQAPAPQWKQTFDALVQALLAGDRRACKDLAARSVISAGDLGAFYLNVVQPAMYTVGNMWENGEISVATEHLASALVNRMMSMQYIELMQPPAADKGKVVVTAAPNEFHEIGATMVANALEAEGWEVSYLGANTPPEDLLGFVSSGNIDILAISASLPFNLEAIGSLIKHIRSWPQNAQPKIMLGGLVFLDHPELAEKLGADATAKDCKQAVELAETWQKKQNQ